MLQNGQYLVSLEMYVGENHGGHVQRPGVTALLIEAKDHDEAATKIEARGRSTLKRINIDLSLEEFFGLFKRFNIVLSQRTLNVDDREFIVINDEATS
jgi:hypothetical protein